MTKHNNSSQPLSSAEEELLKCYAEKQHVLLWGNDSTDLYGLIERIKNVYNERNPYIDEDELIKRADFEGVSPPKDPDYINCGGMNGETVYEALIGRFELFIPDGILIINNLHCDPEDKQHYRKLARVIEERQMGIVSTSFNWLIAYTDDPKPFPSYFKKQFKQILLDGELNELRRRYLEKALQPIGKEPKAEVKQQEEQKELKSKYIFRRDSERWYIKFENEVLKPENLDGFGFIHYLMQYDNKITPKKLYQAVKGVKTSNKEEEDSVETYTVNPREIEKEKRRELEEYHSHTESIPHENKHERLDKNQIKKLADKLKETKKKLLNKRGELEEEGRSLDAEDIEKQIKDVQERINIITRQEHNPEHKQYYDLVYKAIEKAKERINRLSIKNDYDSLLTWNHFEDSIVYNDFHYSYRPTTPISWNL